MLVPISAELRDYSTRLAELVSTLTTVEQRPVADVLQDLRSPTLDVQYIRMMPDGPSGSTPLHEGYLAVKGVHDLLLAAATSAVSSERPTVLPSQKPPQAKGFLDQVRLGQTSRGSYVLRVETPLPPPDIEPPVSSREVLLHLYQATSAAHDAAHSSRNGDLTPFFERVGDGVSANLCEALADIGGQRRSAFDIRFAWAPASPLQLDTPAVHFDSPAITALKDGAKFLRKLPVTETATVIGRVVDLHRTPMDRLGRVQVEGVVEETGQRHEGRVTMRLAPGTTTSRFLHTATGVRCGWSATCGTPDASSRSAGCPASRSSRRPPAEPSSREESAVGGRQRVDKQGAVQVLIAPLAGRLRGEQAGVTGRTVEPAVHARIVLGAQRV